MFIACIAYVSYDVLSQYHHSVIADIGDNERHVPSPH
jgi:hypothetical protein